MHKDKHIVVADPDPASLRATLDLLRDAGCSCHVADSCGEVTRLLSTMVCDLLVLDTHLPSPGGLGLLRDLAATHRIATIITTPRADLDIAMEAVHLAAIGYLPKPLDRTQLLALVEMGLAQSASRQHLQECSRQLEHIQSQVRRMQTVVDEALRLPRLPGVGSALGTPLQDCFAMSHSASARPVGMLAAAPDASNGPPQRNLPHPLVDGLVEAVEVLEQSKRSFKSKELAELRRRLMQLLARQAGTGPDDGGEPH